MTFSIGKVKPLKSLPLFDVELLSPHILLSILTSMTSTEPILHLMLILVVVESTAASPLKAAPVLVAPSHLLMLVMAPIEPSSEAPTTTSTPSVGPLHKLNFTLEHEVIVKLSIGGESPEKLFHQDRCILVDLLKRLPRC